MSSPTEETREAAWRRFSQACGFSNANAAFDAGAKWATERANKRIEELEGGYDWPNRIANLRVLLAAERSEVRRLRALLDADKEGE